MKKFQFKVIMHTASLWSRCLRLMGHSKWGVRESSKVWRKLHDKAFKLAMEMREEAVA